MSEGYRFVPLPNEIRREPREHARHDRRVAGTLSGTLNVVFCAEQPVHIGSGFKRLRDGDIVRRAALVRGGPGILGASLKGVLRSRYEAITHSCALAPPKDGPARSETFRDVKWARFSSDVVRKDVFRGCRDDRLCPACALFGRMSKRSRVSVTDFMADRAFTQASIREQFGPNAHHLGEFGHGEDRGRPCFEILTLKGRKFACEQTPIAPKTQWQNVEVIPAGALLRGSLRVINLLPSELGGLLVALGKEPASALKIGAGKGQQLGRIQLHTLDYDIKDHTRSPVMPDEGAWRRLFVSSADRWGLGEDELVRIHQGSC